MSGKKAQKQQGKARDSDSEDESTATGTEFGATGEKIEFSDHNDPNLLKLLQQKLGLNANPSGFFDALPTQIKNRVYVLKNLHEERRLLEVDFKKEYEALQQKYRTLYQPLYDQRAAVVSGSTEPNAEQVSAAKTKVDAKRQEKLAAEGGNAAAPEQPAATSHNVQDAAKGIPDFWLTALKSHVDLRELVEPEDEPALRHLTDIRWHPLPENPVSFVLEFHFTPNEYFEETLLAKTYHMQENHDSGDLHFSRVDSPTITWKAGKNLCVKQVTKQQKKKGGRKGKGAPTRSITVEEPVNSFFHFFNPEAFLNLQPDLEEEDYEQFLEDDYVMGTEIKDKLIPFGVLYYTGEMEQDEAYDDGEDEEEDEDGEDDEDIDEDESEYKAPAAGAAGANKPECNQQ